MIALPRDLVLRGFFYAVIFPSFYCKYPVAVDLYFYPDPSLLFYIHHVHLVKPTFRESVSLRNVPFVKVWGKLSTAFFTNLKKTFIDTLSYGIRIVWKHKKNVRS